MANDDGQHRLLCYPMPGPVTKQFDTLLDVLRAVDQDHAAQEDLVAWMRRKFSLEDSYARKVYSILLQGTGLLEKSGGVYLLTSNGKEFLQSRDADEFYSLFSDTFFGIDILVRILADAQPASFELLLNNWKLAIRKARPEPKAWSPKHAYSQLRFRLDWLRSLGVVDFVAGRHFLSKKGIRDVSRMEIASAASREDERKISHNDIENKLTTIGAFFQFEVKKRASLNEILPPTNRLRDDRQVDSLWVRFVHFAGKLQYPFEVQLSGSMADAIERLEMISNYVQRAVVVTDEVQKQTMVDRLKVKRSSLLDKLIFLSPDEVDKIVEATIVMRSFTEALFMG